MNEPLILTIDFGTQSVRAGLVNTKGEIVALERVKYAPAYFSPIPGYAEQNPDYYFEELCKATNKLVKENKDKMDDVKNITMAFFRDSIVFADKNMKPLRPAILWLDERRAEGKKKLPLSARAIFKLVGMGPTIDLNRKRSMGVWLEENEPEIWAKTDKVMFLSTYVTYQLLGDYVDSSCCQAGHLPINFKKGEWLKSDHDLTGQVFGVPIKKLCRLVKPGEVMGYVTEEAAKLSGLPKGLKMIAGGSDKSAETLGLGVVDDTMAAVSYGTACSIEVPIKKYSSAEPFLPSYPDIVNGFDMDVQVYRGYWMLNWFTKQFGSTDTGMIEHIVEDREKITLLNEEMAKINPGSDGLVLQPYWGPGLRRPLAKGAIIGFSDVHTKIHMYRAIIEGIAYCLKEGLELFENKRLHHKIDKIRLSGGGSQSDTICQITADIFNKPVSRIQSYECSTIGCAMAGFIAEGIFKDKKEAAEAMVHQSVEFIPNSEHVAKYNYLYKHAYIHMYPSLKHIYSNLKEYRDKF